MPACLARMEKPGFMTGDLFKRDEADILRWFLDVTVWNFHANNIGEKTGITCKKLSFSSIALINMQNRSASNNTSCILCG